MPTIVDHEKIETLVENTFEPVEKELDLLLVKAKGGRGLSLEEAALLLKVTDEKLTKKVLSAAAGVKERLFGKRVVLFAPLYLSNHCTNGCVYCGFRAQNEGVERKALSADEVRAEAARLVEMGFHRVLLVTGEDPRWGPEYVASAIRAAYDAGMRIVHVNAPPTDADGLAILKDAGAGVYQSFQETYHRPTYDRVHPTGRKRDYDYRLGVMDRAMEAGFEDVGIGPLYGLADPVFDTLATIAHSLHLYDEYGTHAHTVSIPRMRPAEGSAARPEAREVADGELKKIVAVVRLALPTAGVVVSTREPEALRRELLHVGATQLSAASRTNPGGYSDTESLEQFSTNDHRGLAEVMASIIEEGYLPSLCTTCYRVGRTGDDFTERTLSGGMKGFCQANALLTLGEYLEDHAANGVSDKVEEAIQKSFDEIEDPDMQRAVREKLRLIREGKRDLFF